MIDDYEEKKELLKELLFGQAGCAIQHDGWSCNTCFHYMKLGISDDRLHELWESTLLVRGDYKNGEYGLFRSKESLTRDVDELINLLDD